MRYQQTALRYARALLGIAKERGHVDSVMSQVENVTKQMLSDKDVFGFLTSPVVKSQNQKEMLTQIFKSLPLREEVQGLLFLLTEKRRFFLLPLIQKALRIEVDFINGIERGSVIAANTLSMQDIKELEKTISVYTNIVTGKQIGRAHV